MDNTTPGIDISKTKFDVALLCQGKLKHKSFKNEAHGFDALLRWLAHQNASEPHTCLEATGVYGEALAEFLYDAGP